MRPSVTAIKPSTVMHIPDGFLSTPAWVAPGTSNHLVGGALLAFALGPLAASLVMVAIHGFPGLTSRQLAPAS